MCGIQCPSAYKHHINIGQEEGGKHHLRHLRRRRDSARSRDLLAPHDVTRDGDVTGRQERDQEWIDSLKADKAGVFTADFEEENGTVVEVRDGTDAVLDCRVYLRHDKTVSRRMKLSFLFASGLQTFKSRCTFNFPAEKVCDMCS